MKFCLFISALVKCFSDFFSEMMATFNVFLKWKHLGTTTMQPHNPQTTQTNIAGTPACCTISAAYLLSTASSSPLFSGNNTHTVLQELYEMGSHSRVAAHRLQCAMSSSRDVKHSTTGSGAAKMCSLMLWITFLLSSSLMDEILGEHYLLTLGLFFRVHATSFQ